MIELLLTCSLLGSVDFEIKNYQDLYRVPYQCKLIEEVQEWIPLINNYFQSESALALTVMYCESRGKEHATGYNNDGSLDQGLMQINSNTQDWLEEKIYKEKLDIYDPETNIKVSSWIVRNIGNWSWWNSSKHCWGRYATN